MIQCDDPRRFLKEHILRGDKSDGVPNILSNDNCLDEGIRQTPLRRAILEKYLRISIEKDDKYYRNYVRNQTLIDFANIPQELVERILRVYDTTHPTHRAEKVFDYLRSNKLDMLLEHIEDFKL
jgi:NH3-dependent NAD+ synthetase